MLRVWRDGRVTYHRSPTLTRGRWIDPATGWYQVYLLGIQASLIRRRCLDAVGHFDEGLRHFEDMELFMRLSRAYELVHIRGAAGGLRANLGGDRGRWRRSGGRDGASCAGTGRRSSGSRLRFLVRESRQDPAAPTSGGDPCSRPAHGRDGDARERARVRIAYVNARYRLDTHDGPNAHSRQFVENAVALGHDIWMSPGQEHPLARRLPRSRLARVRALRTMDAVYVRLEHSASPSPCRWAVGRPAPPSSATL